METRSQYLQIRVTPREKAMLKRFARRAGQSLSRYILSRSLPRAQARFDEILRALQKDENRRFALAELNDFLSDLAPMEFEDGVRFADLRELSPFVQNYVAAMVEQASSQKGVEPPGWTRDVVALDEPFFATPLKSLRPYLLQVAPVPFKRRNIFIDAGVGARV